MRYMIAVALLAGTASAGAQSFGGPLMKSKVTLQRKLPALVQLPGTTVTIAVTGHSDAADLTQDFKSMLGSELLKDDPRLSIEDHGGDSIINCQITTFEHPTPTTSERPGIQTGKTAAKPVTYTRVTGMMRVSFQARGRSGGESRERAYPVRPVARSGPVLPAPAALARARETAAAEAARADRACRSL